MKTDRILAMSPAERKIRGINKSTLWWQRKTSQRVRGLSFTVKWFQNKP